MLRKNDETTVAQREGFAKCVATGVRIAFGTDSGIYPHGLNARQFAYQVRYGQTPLEAIRSATLHAAELMRWEDRIGPIAPGPYADLIAVAATRSTTSGCSRTSVRDEGRRGCPPVPRFVVPLSPEPVGASSYPLAEERILTTPRGQRLPRRSCSRSIASNSALKLPLPKPSEPCRSMNS